MARMTTMRDDEHKATMVVLGIKAEEMFTDEFRSWLENLLLCVMAKNMAAGKEAEEAFRECNERVIETVVKAALAMSHKVGMELTSDENAEESFRRMCILIGGEETK